MKLVPKTLRSLVDGAVLTCGCGAGMIPKGQAQEARKQTMQTLQVPTPRDCSDDSAQASWTTQLKQVWAQMEHCRRTLANPFAPKESLGPRAMRPLPFAALSKEWSKHRPNAQERSAK